MKNLFAIIVLLFITSGTIAQSDLFVGNGAYVFVDGDGFTSGPNVAPLYVNDDVNIAATGNIYLRDEAQLLQGNETARNVGLGNISIYQEGKSNKWSYNYWCSPVGLPGATATNGVFASARMQEVTGLLTSQNFNFNPTSQYDGDDTTMPVNIASAWFFTFVTSDDYSEWNFIGDALTAAPGLGFTMKGTSAITGGFDVNTDGQRIDFRGKPNTGTINVTTSAPVNDPGDVDGDGLLIEPQWTLTGNPYPSAIDMRDLIWDAQNIVNGVGGDADDITTGALYYWDQELSDNSHNIESYTGGYGTATIDNAGVFSYVAATYHMYDGSGNIVGGMTSSPKPYQPNRYIPVGQGFMVEGNAGGTFRIKNTHRVFRKESVPADNSTFFGVNNTNNEDNNAEDEITDNDNLGLTDEGYPAIPDDYKRFRLFVEFSELYTRELLQNFHANATDGFDYGLEAKSPEGVASDASWVLNNLPYVIQAHDFNESLKIPLVIKLQETQPINFRIADVQHFSESQSIYLHDIENGIYHDLREDNVDFILEAGDYTTKFEITFTEDTLGISEDELNAFKVIQNNSLEQLTILNPNQLDIQSVGLIDITGKQIFKTVDLESATKHSFSTANLSDGVYITNITLGNEKTITQKVIIKNNK